GRRLRAFFFSSRRRHTRLSRDGVQTCALPIFRDSAVEWWRNWLRLTVLNLVWMASWLTVLLGPPVTLAVYAYLERLTDNDEMTPGEFLAEVRRNLLKGWLWALPVLALLASLFVSLPFYAQFPDLRARAAEFAGAVRVVGGRT